MNKNQIIDFCLDNGNLSNEELSQQLISLLQKNEHKPYDHDNESVLGACGLEDSKNLENGKLILPPKDCSKRSQAIEFYEKNLTKRELSFYFTEVVHKMNMLLEVLDMSSKLGR